MFEKIPVESIVLPALLVRKDVLEEGINGLAESIKADGLNFPIGVCKKDSHYELVYGHRRYRAVLRLGWKQVDAKVFPEADRVRMLLRMLEENFQRENPNPIDEADIIVHLLEEGMTSKEIASSTHVSEGLVSQRLSLRKKAIESVQKAVSQKKISAAQAREIVRTTDPGEQQELLDRAVKGTSGAALKHVADVAKRRDRVRRGKVSKPDSSVVSEYTEHLKDGSLRKKEEFVTLALSIYDRLKRARTAYAKEYLRGAGQTIEWALGIRDNVG